MPPRRSLLLLVLVPLLAWAGEDDPRREVPQLPDLEEEPMGCDPYDPCPGGTVGEGAECGEVSAGCPGATGYCACADGLACVEGVCRFDPKLQPQLPPEMANPTVENGCGLDDDARAKLGDAFVACAGDHAGQRASIEGFTCAQVCCALGMGACRHRAAQADLKACTPENPSPSGACEDQFRPAWSSQCTCTHAPAAADQLTLKLGSLAPCLEGQQGGPWRFHFRVTRKGKVKLRKLTPKSRPGSGFGACIRERIAGWQLLPRVVPEDVALEVSAPTAPGD